MLVLSRKEDQSIRIGNDIVITLLQIRGGTVKIGIEAPTSIHIVRAELDEETKETLKLETKGGLE